MQSNHPTNSSLKKQKQTSSEQNKKVLDNCTSKFILKINGDELPTTKEFKEKAKELKISRNLSSHSKALNELSKLYGYRDYNTIKPNLKEEPKSLGLEITYPINKEQLEKIISISLIPDRDKSGQYFMKRALRIYSILIDIFFTYNQNINHKKQLDFFLSLCRYESLIGILIYMNDNQTENTIELSARLQRELKEINTEIRKDVSESMIINTNESFNRAIKSITFDTSLDINMEQIQLSYSNQQLFQLSMFIE